MSYRCDITICWKRILTEEERESYLSLYINTRIRSYGNYDSLTLERIAEFNESLKVELRGVLDSTNRFLLLRDTLHGMVGCLCVRETNDRLDVTHIGTSLSIPYKETVRRMMLLVQAEYPNVHISFVYDEQEKKQVKKSTILSRMWDLSLYISL